MENKKDRINNIKEVFMITVGVLLVVIGVYFFKFPNNFAIGGVTGIAVILSSFFGSNISSGTVVLIINILLLIVSYIFLGKDFSNRTAYGSLLMSLSLRALELIVPLEGSLTNEPMLDLSFAVLLPALGSAILFNIGASTGGTDIIVMLLKKYTNINTGSSLFFTDSILTISSFFVFNLQTGLFSLLGLIMRSTIVDTVIENLNLHKYFTIICEDPAPISNFIIHKLHRSATLVDGKGMYMDRDKKLIFTVVNRTQAVMLRKYIKEIEPGAFILITNTSEIIGRGFRT